MILEACNFNCFWPWPFNPQIRNLCCHLHTIDKQLCQIWTPTIKKPKRSSSKEPNIQIISMSTLTFDSKVISAVWGPPLSYTHYKQSLSQIWTPHPKISAFMFCCSFKYFWPWPFNPLIRNLCCHLHTIGKTGKQLCQIWTPHLKILAFTLQASRQILSIFDLNLWFQGHMILNLRCHLHTMSNHCAKYEHHPSKEC